MDLSTRYVRRVEPLAIGWRCVAWAGGRFDTAHRPYTPLVEGEIRTPAHLLLVTLRGGAERLEVDSDCGHRYRGEERRGMVSFVPAHCTRRLRMRGVHSQWASVSLRPELLDMLARDGAERITELGAFTNAEDPLLAGLVAEFERLHALDGALDPTWCDAMSLALAHCLLRRHGRREPAALRRPQRLPAWQLRRLAEYVDAGIEGGISILDLATAAGMSVGHLHRAFRASTGLTPLEFINARRIRRAVQILATETAPIAEVAARVGFASQSHFARIFRRKAGMPPSAFRKKR